MALALVQAGTGQMVASPAGPSSTPPYGITLGSADGWSAPVAGNCILAAVAVTSTPSTPAVESVTGSPFSLLG